MLRAMNLEDHLGDILRKGRWHASVSLETAAAAAGLAPAELDTLENDGVLRRSLDFARVGQLLHLHPVKLEQIARGWLPSPPDLGRWRELRPILSRGGGFPVNCYLIWDEVTCEAALFDTGFDPEPVFQLIDAYHLLLRHVFVTHGHHDHVAAVAQVRARFPKVRLHSGSPQAPVELRNRPNECLPLGSLRITHRDTPGHADDGVTYIAGNWPEDAPAVAFVGDALFAGSMGKAPGNARLAREKIVGQLLSLPPDTLLCPGHGPLTTVAEEKAHNPFF